MKFGLENCNAQCPSPKHSKTQSHSVSDQAVCCNCHEENDQNPEIDKGLKSIDENNLGDKSGLGELDKEVARVKDNDLQKPETSPIPS